MRHENEELALKYRMATQKTAALAHRRLPNEVAVMISPGCPS